MPRSGFVKKALQTSAFFIIISSSSTVVALCPSDRYDETVTIAQVYDGDTVKLVDGRKLRLIGINTPELARDQYPSEAYAIEARQYLQQHAWQERRWRVRWGAQKKDHYGRWLGHVFIDDRNLGAEMLRQGLASVIAIPPNQWALACYQQQEEKARQEAKGVWSRQGYRLWRADKLPDTLHGFQFIQGSVARIVQTRKSLWLELSPQFSIRIARDDLKYFDQHDPHQWKNKKIEVRGWLNHHQGRLKMRIKHPAAVHIIE